MTRFALTIEFDGGPYMGWQWQDHGPSVQGAIEEAIFKTTGEKTLVYSAGRTDAGVHALGMRAHVDIEKGLPAFRFGGHQCPFAPAPDCNIGMRRGRR